MRGIRAAGGTKLRDDAGTYKTQRVQPSYGEASCGAKRKGERRIVPESFLRAPVLCLTPRPHALSVRRPDGCQRLAYLSGRVSSRAVAQRCDRSLLVPRLTV